MYYYCYLISSVATDDAKVIFFARIHKTALLGDAILL